MSNLLEDITQAIKSYYDDLVAVLPKLGIAFLVLIITLIIAGWLRRFSRRALGNRMEDPLLADFLSRVLNTILVIIGFVVILNIIGLGGAAASLLAGAGIGAFVIGFAFKDIGENFLAGILMAFKRPFKIGDIIETQDITGKVISLTLRDTQIKTFSGKDVFIPNGAIMKNPIINRTIDGYLRYQFSIGLAYEDNLREGINIIRNTIQNTPGVLNEDGREVKVLFEELGTSTVNATAYFWVNMDHPKISGVAVQSEAIEATVTALSDAGYYLPADIIEIKNYQDKSLFMEDLRQAVKEG